MNERGREWELVLVDFDDTIVETAPLFERARAEMFDVLADAGFAREEAYRIHHEEVDPEMRERHGFGPRRIPFAFRETYHRLCRTAGRPPDETRTARLMEIGRAVAGTPPCFDGAIDALRRLAEAYPTIVYTQSGEPEYQLGCIRDAGVLDVLPQERVRISPQKTVDEFRAVLRHYDVDDAANTCMIGNSMRSDINPALSVGARAIHIEVETSWIHDLAAPVSEDFVRVRSFPAAVRHLLDGAVPATFARGT